ncbi:hypothetical protein BD324DRAFT_679276 [Kockovaella imperatae]|uniref:Rho-GAP domain-containing protein n=1 Tax=Kockovaella imperatae TaxID=4999 RepID=A0A1Y1US06_9TREE|nr:hypothetical protein BD324DRAFT_679276 [Kockovaella imperatae]ORX40246.1 hypothetical protein BD324DRAFT_679276 [Kockovaella imperatae]
MSPSKIPRLGGLPPSPLGPNGRKISGTTTMTETTAPDTPKLGPPATIHSKIASRIPQPASPGLTARGSPRLQSPITIASSPNSPSSLPVPKASHRRKTPSNGLSPPVRRASGPAPQSPRRRPVPVLSGSDDESQIPHLTPRRQLRHPASTMNLGKAPKPIKGRSRAKSAAASTTRPDPATADVPAMPTISPTSRLTSLLPAIKTYLFDSSTESREAVPPHISSRLKMINQLAEVLGKEPKDLQDVIDIPGLLARVDAAHEKGFGAYPPGENGGSLGRRTSSASTSGSQLNTAEADAPKGHSRSASSDRGGKRVFGLWKHFGKRGVTEEASSPLIESLSTDDGPVFGVALNEAPNGSWCTSLIGGQKHDLPLVMFTVTEEIYRRGMSQPGIFRLAGDGHRLSHLIDTYNTSPLYGDGVPLDGEPVHNLTGLIKRYVRDLPEPILDEAIFPALLKFCATDPVPGEPGTPPPLSPEAQITAAQLLLQLLPPPHFSLLMYLLAFLGQLPLFPDNRLNIDSISIIFGPAVCAPRGKGISGLGPVPVGRGSDASESDKISALVNDSQVVLAWLLKNWGDLSAKMLQDDSEELSMSSSSCSPYDPRLLSPIDLRGATAGDSPYSGRPSMESKPAVDPAQILSPPDRWSSMNVLSPPLSASPTDQSPRESTTREPTGRPRSSTSAMSPSPSFGLGLFHRAKSSSNLALEADRSSFELSPSMSSGGKAKRSASFTSLSSLLKLGSNKPESNMKSSPGRRSTEESRHPPANTNTKVHTIVDSLHDLLISKDKQIERDARELALLRHTLLEMDEKLQRMSGVQEASYLSSLRPGAVPSSIPLSSHSSSSSGQSTYSQTSRTPSITITSSNSSQRLALPSSAVAVKDTHLNQLQDQLSAALTALDAARSQNHEQKGRMYDLERQLARCESEHQTEVARFEVQLAIEQTRVRGLVEERDLARDRLDKVKSSLFAVA